MTSMRTTSRAIWRIRYLRQAQTVGPMKYTTGIPSARSRRASRRLKSGLSMRSAARGLRSSATRRSVPRARRSLGIAGITSTNPITERSSARTSVSQPSARSRGPPAPNARPSGSRERNPRRTEAPWASALASTATTRSPVIRRLRTLPPRFPPDRPRARPRPDRARWSFPPPPRALRSAPTPSRRSSRDLSRERRSACPAAASTSSPPPRLPARASPPWRCTHRSPRWPPPRRRRRAGPRPSARRRRRPGLARPRCPPPRPRALRSSACAIPTRPPERRGRARTGAAIRPAALPARAPKPPPAARRRRPEIGAWKPPSPPSSRGADRRAGACGSRRRAPLRRIRLLAARERWTRAARALPSGSRRRAVPVLDRSRLRARRRRRCGRPAPRPARKEVENDPSRRRGRSTASARDTPLRPFQEGDEVVDLRMTPVLRPHVGDGLAQAHLGAEDGLVGRLHARNRLLVEMRPGEAVGIDAHHFGAIPVHRAIGRNVLRHHRPTGDEREPSDPGELVHSREPAEDHPVLDDDVAAERGAVREHAPVAELHVVRDMAVRHHQATIADPGHPAARRRAQVDGDELAELVAVADHNLGLLARVFQVLGDGADGGELENHVVRADGRVAFDDRVGPNPRARADLHLRPDHRIGGHLDRRIQLCVPIDDGGRMDHGLPLRAAMVAIISASLASSPSTFASPASRQIDPFCRSTRTCRSSLSPGITTRRNFTLSKAIK